MMPCYTDMDYRTLGSATCERSSPFGWILSRRFYQECFHAEHDHADLASRSLHLGERLAEHRDVLPGLVCSLVQLLALSKPTILAKTTYSCMFSIWDNHQAGRWTLIWAHKVQCGAVMTGHFSHKFLQKTPHSSPVGARYQMSSVDPASVWYSALVPVIIYVISYILGLL